MYLCPAQCYGFWRRLGSVDQQTSEREAMVSYVQKKLGSSLNFYHHTTKTIIKFEIASMTKKKKKTSHVNEHTLWDVKCARRLKKLLWKKCAVNDVYY
mmetsp:Transcript_40239/g.65632  ORF Transcript_40239/g.65632 Transcript_40239/m.65632 type:complete len:98 (+) Transcript_40239:370-663(+)